LAGLRAAEGAIIAACGIACAALLAHWLGSVLAAIAAPALPRATPFTIDLRWLFAAAACALATTVTASVWPGAEGPLDLRGASAAGRTRSVTRSLLIVLETSLALMLAVGATLVTMSFVKLVRVEPGFDPDSLVAIRLRQPIFKPGEVVVHYPLQRFARTVGAVVSTVGRVEGVRDSAALSFAPFTGERVNARIALLDVPKAGSPQARGASELPDSAWLMVGDLQRVTPEFFATLGVPVLRGRAFTDRDTLEDSQFDDFDAPRGLGAVIVSESLARRVWPGHNPLGKYLRVWGGEYNSSEVVGVVADARYGGLAHDAPPVLYMPYGQSPTVGATVLIRTTQPAEVVPRVRAALAGFGSELAVGEVWTMDDLIRREAGPRRISAGIMTFFASVGLGLAALGLAGTVAFLVRRRTPEIGIRIALGASPAQVVRLFVGETLSLVGAGVVIGLACATVASRVLTTLLFDVRPHEPVVYGAAALTLVLIARAVRE
jgi:predicted permease